MGHTALQQGETGLDDSSLRASARAFITAGRVSVPLPDQRWGGPGTGAQCMLCGAATEPHEIEIEIDNPRGGNGHCDSLCFHAACLAAIEREAHG
jgi:hypothetical protein